MCVSAEFELVLSIHDAKKDGTHGPNKNGF